MNEPHTQPETWAQAAHGWTEEFFKMRLFQNKSVPHLREAKAYERANKNRENRIERLDEQINRALTSMSNHQITELIEDELEREEVDREWIGRLNEAKA